MAEKHKKKCRQYSIDYLKFGFITSPTNQQLPFVYSAIKCFLMKQRKQFPNRSSIDGMFNKAFNKNDGGLVASYNISLLIAKCGTDSIYDEVGGPSESFKHLRGRYNG